MNNEVFSNILKKSLAEENLSALAKQLEIPKSLLHDWMQAKRSPSLASMHHVRKIARHIGISFEELLFGEIEKEEKTLTTVTFNDNGNKYSVSITKLKD